MVRAKAVLASEEAGEGRHRASMRRLREIDWDFPSQPSESAFSSLHWHPCRFPSQIPAIAVARLTSPGDTVLDPFMGSGTTLVEAQRLGRRSTGIAREVMQSRPSCHFALVITSPPYFGVTDYVKAQRLSLEWMSNPIEPVRLLEVGARSKRHRRNAGESYLQEIRGAFVE